MQIPLSIRNQRGEVTLHLLFLSLFQLSSCLPPATSPQPSHLLFPLSLFAERILVHALVEMC